MPDEWLNVRKKNYIIFRSYIVQLENEMVNRVLGKSSLRKVQITLLFFCLAFPNFGTMYFAFGMLHISYISHFKVKNYKLAEFFL